MAKLDTTVENIQLKNNMIIAGASDADWLSDSKYPSAKAVFTKLSNIPGGTTVDTNQTVKAGNVTFGVDDTVEFVAGSNVSISGDAATKKITISATDTNTEASLTVIDKTNTDNTDLVYAITNLSESGTKGHTLTPTYTGLPTKAYVDRVATGAVEYLGTVSALTGLSTTAAKGDFYRVLTAFTVGSETAHVGDILIATKDNPAQTAADWDVIHAEVDSNTWVANTATAAGYVAAPGANVANKVWKTDSTGAPGWRDDANTDTGVTSVEVTGAGNAVTGATYDAGSRKLTLTKGATYITDAYTKAEVNTLVNNLQLGDKFPIGSILITAQSANPTTTLGGTWTLVDKEFKNATITLGTDPSTPTSVAGPATSISSETIIYNDHSILLRLDIQVRSSSTITTGIGQDPVLLADLSIGNYGNYGVTRLSSGIVKDIAFATPNDTTASSVICYSIDEEGNLWLNDILNAGAGTGTVTRKLSGGTHIYINTVIPIPYTDMKDSYCDKFYWKRTA